MTADTSSIQGIEGTYERRRRERLALDAALERQHTAFGATRLLIAGGVVLLVGLTGLRFPVGIAAGVAAFALAAVLHARLLTRRSKLAAAVAFYDRGLLRIRHSWMGAGRSGDAYRQTEHPYADDLDLFGRGSLFELLATTRTKAGEEVLARWLNEPAEGRDTRARQGAVREFSGLIDLRERMATTGDTVRSAVDAPILRRWATAPIELHNSAARVALFLLAATTSTSIVVWLSTGRLGGISLALSVGQGLLAWFLQARVRRVIESVEEPSHDLNVLTNILTILEREQFTSPHLVALSAKLTRAVPASREIAGLARRVEMLSSRRNALFVIPSAFMLWGTQWAAAIEAWRARAGTDIPLWLDVVGGFEALAAVGEYAALHPTHVYPDVTDGDPEFSATDLRHPTLGASAVGNDMSLARNGCALLIVSGSNMSGKSTWLRTIGTTVVLAGLGAPVRATSCRLSPLAIGAAIRVSDSLADGKSRFFAEITRLKAILDAARARRGDLLFLLDEILSGTNSHDRQVGAEALIRGLLESGAIGLVTTHDLAIGQIVDTMGARATNTHFADEFIDGALHFDYRMKPGVVQTRNALALMRSIGIEV